MVSQNERTASSAPVVVIEVSTQVKPAGVAQLTVLPMIAVADLKVELSCRATGVTA